MIRAHIMAGNRRPFWSMISCVSVYHGTADLLNGHLRDVAGAAVPPESVPCTSQGFRSLILPKKGSLGALPWVGECVCNEGNPSWRHAPVLGHGRNPQQGIPPPHTHTAVKHRWGNLPRCSFFWLPSLTQGQQHDRRAGTYHAGTFVTAAPGLGFMCKWRRNP